ncbi:GNAT family N-acetyltransferase [Tenuibacillus multivorans]|uniref:Acetyltransferase (GNAT) family protein n=1 Tax=Tenuibacillus multivorans TaxID=237069 RepID=A0A1H0AVF4_9BACI|nr:GNAT family N-acetyltransferase [Tenuibacillus multivorans]GEL77803.1 hypothetical protein TMU01_20380 [Tenuibacillus multivorans]SDN37369.1 Acetyltransferase (GNAT) family protein [Tenuibacillus multivorans]
MKHKIIINRPISNHEVPELRELVGWGGRPQDYPALFERCNFWAGARNENNKLIAFGYVCGMVLEHGYMEDIIVHPDYQGQGIGSALVTELLNEAERFGLEIVTVTFERENTNFYKRNGFTRSSGGVWQRR